MKLASFLIVLFGNLWIWRIFAFSGPLAILVALCAFSFHFLISKHRLKKSFKIFLLLFGLLLFFQWKTTDKISLTRLSNDQQRVQQMRLKEYPPVKVDILGKTIWVPLAHWFEGRPESIAFFRILDNFSQTIDPNLYFFANHPRERVGFGEFEKFPFLLLPFFIYGVLRLINNKVGSKLTVCFGIPIVLLSFIGTQNPIGPFSLFPFIGVSTVHGVETFMTNLKSLTPSRKKIIVFGLTTLYVLILIQLVSYAIN